MFIVVAQEAVYESFPQMANILLISTLQDQVHNTRRIYALLR